MKKSIVLLIILLILFIGAIFWWQNGNYPVNKESKEIKTFVISQGDNVRAIAYNLKSQELIRDPIVFFLITKQTGLDKKIQAGSFRLSPSMNTYDIAENLTHGTLDIWVTIASLVERESKHDEDRPIVASVILNRLEIGMKLDIDATIQYAKGKIDNKWWRPILRADYSLNSPYNTYQINGLPPGPISNPGLASLKAVVNPSNTSYLFYITDKTGTNRYAKTLAEQQENINKYGLSN